MLPASLSLVLICFLASDGIWLLSQYCFCTSFAEGAPAAEAAELCLLGFSISGLPDSGWGIILTSLVLGTVFLKSLGRDLVCHSGKHGVPRDMPCQTGPGSCMGRIVASNSITICGTMRKVLQVNVRVITKFTAIQCGMCLYCLVRNLGMCTNVKIMYLSFSW